MQLPLFQHHLVEVLSFSMPFFLEYLKLLTETRLSGVKNSVQMDYPELVSNHLSKPRDFFTP